MGADMLRYLRFLGVQNLLFSLIRVIPRNPRFHSLLRAFVSSREKRRVLRLLVARLD